MEENNNVENVQEVANNVGNQGEVTLENSNIKIADDVIAVIAGAAASEVPGVAINGRRICRRNFRSI